MRIFDTENIDLSVACFNLCLESAFSYGCCLRLHLQSTVEELSLKEIRHRFFFLSGFYTTKKAEVLFRNCSADVFLAVIFLVLVISSFLYYKVCYLIINQTIMHSIHL